MKFIAVLFLFCFVTILSISAQVSTINLAGEWQVSLNPKNKLFQKYPERSNLNGSIEFPGSLAENGFGYKTSGSDFGILTSEYKYIGKAWYTKEIEIPENWANKTVEIFLERVLRESRVYIDGEERSKQDALGTPHIHELGKLLPGKHELIVQVNNEMIHNIGDKGHVYGEYTQSIWNGIVGRMEMRAKDLVWLQGVKVDADIQNESLHITTGIYSEESSSAKIDYEIVSVSSNETIIKGSLSDNIRRGKTSFEWPVKTNGQLKKWSEFTPEVYMLRLKLSSGAYNDYLETEFGYCRISRKGGQFFVNEIPVTLHGNLELIKSQIEGFESCNTGDWIKVLTAFKAKGFNHICFQLYCPPEAAFKAASRVGLYLQIEPLIMQEEDMRGNKTLQVERKYVAEHYENYPSFVFFQFENFPDN